MPHLQLPMPTEPIEIAIAVVEHDGRFLIGLRPGGAPLAGLWEFAGGKVEPGETPQTAAARECLEETGLAVEVGQPYPDIVHQYDHGRLRLHFFRCRPLDPQALPAERFRWVTAGELSHYEFPAANQALTAYLANQP